LGGSYMYGHGFATTFLSCLVGEEDTERRRRELVRILEAAAKYSREAQTSRGGWGYKSAKDGGDFDEGSCTVQQVQALRAARNARIIVPTEAIKDSVKYLEACTMENGRLMYSLTTRNPSITPALTAAAICCGFSAGEYDSPVVKKWFRYCKDAIFIPTGGG